MLADVDDPVNKVDDIPSSSQIGLLELLATSLSFERHPIRTESVTWSANQGTRIEEHEYSTSFHTPCKAKISRSGIVIAADNGSFRIAHGWKLKNFLTGEGRTGDFRMPFLMSRSHKQAKQFTAKNGDFWSIEYEANRLGLHVDIFWHRLRENILYQFIADTKYSNQCGI